MTTEIQALLKTFSNKHSEEVKNSFRLTENGEILTSRLPKILEDSLDLEAGYIFKGSVGTGNWAEIPWIVILDTDITNTPTEGYYVAILLDKQLKNIHLVLATGWTQFKTEYGNTEGRIQIEAVCKRYALLLNPPTDLTLGTIDLGAENDLGKGYEQGAIISKKYSIDDLDGDTFVSDIKIMLDLYKNLKNIVGNSILNLEIDLSEYDEQVKEFNKLIAQESLEKDINKSLLDLVEMANQSPPEIRHVLKTQIVRNKKFANFVKERVGFVCEICNLKPFTQKNGKPYAEADHVVPLGGEVRGLDSPNNMRCVCAQCHSIVTYGSDEEMNNLFSKNHFVKNSVNNHDLTR